MLNALLSLALLGGSGGPPDDVLVILLDDVGKDLLSIYDGPEPARTPNLDLLADSGRVYDRAYSLPLCSPSRACVVTGRYGFRTGYGRNPGRLDQYALRPEDLCVPELIVPFVDASMQLFNKWHLVHSEGDLASDRHAVEVCGFERFFGHVANVGAEPTVPDTDHYFWRRVQATPLTTDVEIVDGYAEDDFSPDTWATSVCKDELVRRLNHVDLDRRVVFFWSPVAPHAPFQAPPTTLLSAATAATIAPAPAMALPGEERAYALAMLEALDSVIGEALAEIRPQRLARMTILVMGDNGTAREALHPSLDEDHAKGTLHELGIGVPLIVAGPRVADPGSRDDSLVHVVDLVATIAELVGAPPPTVEDSVSFAGTFTDGLPGARETLFAERFDPNGMAMTVASQAVVGQRYKLMRDLDPDGLTEELYDLQLDPGETNDLLAGVPTPETQQAYDELKAVLDDLVGPASVSFCNAADDSLADCPCENPGDPTTGCDLSQATGGVGLDVLRQELDPERRVTFLGTGFPPSMTPTVVLRSPARDPLAPVVFGDGLRCIGTPLVRLGATSSTGGVTTHELEQSGAPAGPSHYQLFFRNLPAAYCSPDSAFNLSNGRTVYW